MIALTQREKALILFTAVVALISGIWFGLTLVPVEALDIPTNTRNDTLSPAYYPVPTYLPIVTVISVFGAAWFSYSLANYEPDDENNGSPDGDSP